MEDTDTAWALTQQKGSVLLFWTGTQFEAQPEDAAVMTRETANRLLTLAEDLSDGSFDVVRVASYCEGYDADE